MPALTASSPLVARALFALPPRAGACSAGAPPPHAAGLEPDAWLVARLAARDASPRPRLPLDELRAGFERAGRDRVGPPAPAGARRGRVRSRAPPARCARGSTCPAGGRGARGRCSSTSTAAAGSRARPRRHEPACRLLAHLAGRARAVGRLPPRARAPVPGRGRRRARRVPRRRARARPSSAPTRRASRSAATAPAATSRRSAPALRGEPAAPAFQLLIYPGARHDPQAPLAPARSARASCSPRRT